MISVGSTIIVDEERVYIGYNKVPCNKNGWADPLEYLPRTFDLVHLLTDRNKNVPGWWSGDAWMSHRLKQKDKVVGWRKSEDL